MSYRKALGFIIMLTLTGTGTAMADTLYYVHTDRLGTPQAMTDANQQVVWLADYDPFGQAAVRIEQVKLPIRFPGQYYDEETGLHYNYFRDYDPSTGRYIQPDPIGLVGGLNTYAYVENNPLKWIDPLGLVNVRPPSGAGFGGGIGPGSSLSGGIGGPGFGGGPRGSGISSTSARTPVGSNRSPINVPSPQNRPGTIGGREYTGHAFDRMQGRGIPPSAVENAIKNGSKTPGNRPGTTQHYDPVNNITAVTNESGRVMTIRNGPPSVQNLCP